MIGSTLGHFRIERKLGAGGMGEVYRARDTKLGRDVALKLLPQTTPEKLARFEREARAVAGLAHPNIVVLHAIEHHEGQHFLVMELVEGQDLSELVAAGGLPLARVLELAIPLADALASAHERGIVHRDLKPANVKLARDGRVKVLDFGLARMLESDLEQTMEAPLTGAGNVMGTVPYMAPEQLRGDPVDARADLFAFGVIVYELATGRRPFEGRSLADVTSAILRDAPAAAALPPDFERIVATCLAKNPRERFASALELANELRRLSVGKPAREARAADEVSIAVLPFANRSASADDEYFAEGLADELTGVLARIRGLRVAARTSAARFKGTSEDLAAVGRKLNVATLLEGSVRMSGNRVRIVVQLVRAANGDTMWSQTYDRTIEDVFAVQDDIAHSVVKELRKALLGEADDTNASREAKAEVARAAARGRSENPEAQRLLLQARHIGQRRTMPDLETALALLDRAIALDPFFAAAWAEAARLHYIPVTIGQGDPDFHLARARAAVERALELEPDLGVALAHQAWMQVIDRDMKGAAETLRRAHESDPDDPRVLAIAGNLAMYAGRFDEATAFYHRLIQQDPLALAGHLNLGTTRLAAGDAVGALEAYDRGIELAPRSPAFHFGRARSLLRLGRLEEALAAADRETNEPFRFLGRGLVLDAMGRRTESDAELNGLIERHAKEAPVQIAMLYAARHENERAFEWLEHARATRDPGLGELKVGREYDFLHDDPRWTELLRWIGLES